jgi:hypothetical protein
MNVTLRQSRGQKENRMITFTIQADNNITAFAGVQEAAQDGECNRAVRQNRNMSLPDDFPIIPHQSAGAGVECCGCIVAEESGSRGDRESKTTLRCNECGAIVGSISTGILEDLVTLATNLDEFLPDSGHINALPRPLRRYIHDLETRADPAGDVAQIAILKETVAALEARIRELES